MSLGEQVGVRAPVLQRNPLRGQLSATGPLSVYLKRRIGFVGSSFATVWDMITCRRMPKTAKERCKIKLYEDV